MGTLLQIGLSNAVAAGVLALAAGAAERVCRRRPAVVHALWLLVLVKLVTPPLVDVSVPWPAPAASLPADPPAREDLPAVESAGGENVPRPEEAPVVVVEAVADGDLAPEAAGAAPPVSSPWSWEHVLCGAWLAGSLGWTAARKSGGAEPFFAPRLPGSHAGRYGKKAGTNSHPHAGRP